MYKIESLVNRIHCRYGFQLFVSHMSCLYSKHIRGDVQRTKELLKSAINRAPLVVVPTLWRGDCLDESSSGPDLPDDT